jgi:butyryl-CoA dehydrogenase
VQEWDRTNEAPLHSMLAEAADHGLLGITIPVEYGGLGLFAIDYALAVEEICRVSHSWLPAEVIFRTSGPGPNIILGAAEERCRQKFLPDIVGGRRTCAIALTEPDHGTAMTDLETTAVDDGDVYILNGKKRYVTGCPEDDLYTVFVRFRDTPGAAGVGAIVVEKGMPGLTAEPGRR